MSTSWLRRTLELFTASKPVASTTPPLEPLALDAASREVHQLLATGQIDLARARLAALLRSNPDHAQVQAQMGMAAYLDGDIHAAIPHLFLAAQKDSEHADAFKFLAACLEAERDDFNAIEVNQRAVQLNPNDVQVLCIAAALNTRIGRFDIAAELLNRAIKIQPDSMLAMQLLESVSKRSTYRRDLFEASKQVSEARTRLEHKLLAEHRKKGLDAERHTLLLSLLEGDQATFPQALQLADASADAPPLTAALAEQIASVFWLAGRGEDMLRLRERAHALAPQDVMTELALNHARLMQDDGIWRESFRSMVQILVQTRPEVHPKGVALWKGERIKRGKLLVYQDQGVGDALVGLRFLSLLKAHGVTFDLWVVPCARRLAQAYLGKDQVIESEVLPKSGESAYAVGVPLFGLVPAFKLGQHDLDIATRLHIDPAHRTDLREMVRALSGLKVGLMWAGNPHRRDDWMRHLPAECLKPLRDIKNVSWVNLTTDARNERAEVMEALTMTDPMPKVTDFYDTAAIIDELDAVISIDSSVAHLAAALDKPLWVLLPTMLDWRWQMGSIMSPWWPKAHVKRADLKTGFTQAIVEVSRELEAYLTTK